MASGMILAGSLLVVTLACARLAAMEQRARTAVLAAERVSQDVATLERLRASRQTVGAGTKPQADAIALVNAALADAGLPATRLQSLGQDLGGTASQSLTGSPNGGLMRQSVRLNLAELSLPEFGRFLRSWRSTQAVWSVDQIGLQHIRAERIDLPTQWTASLRMSASYWAVPDQPGGRP
jgi:hypothetical protein